MNFNISEIFNNIINYLVQYFIKVDTDLPWLKFTVLITVILMIITRIKIIMDAKKQVGKNLEYLKKHQKNSEKIKKQNFIDRERKIINSNITYIAFCFKFFKFKKNENKTENPNFKKLVLSFLSDISLYKGTFIKTNIPGSEQYYFLKFNLQEEAINFIQHFENSVEEFSPILQDFGYEMSYKIAIDNRNKDIESEKVITCLESILKIAQDYGVYTTMLFKEFYDRNANDKVYLSFNPQGKYMIGTESIEIYHLEK